VVDRSRVVGRAKGLGRTLIGFAVAATAVMVGDVRLPLHG
jgi:hypothetical protein